jgi:xanthine dehydrogenase accessory factor
VASIVPKTALPEEVLAAALRSLQEGAVVALATVVERHGSAPSTPGQKLALVSRRSPNGDASLEALGTVGGGAVEHAVLAAMHEAVCDPDARPKMSTFRLGPNLGMCCGGSTDILIEPMRPALAVLLVGAGHVGVSTAPILASLGFRVVLSDARDDAVAPERTADLGAKIVHADHDDPEVLAALGAPPDRSMIVVMTHDHQLDQQVIEWALGRGFAFVGGVGSRAKAARTAQRLAAKGFSESDIARVRMPVGVDIGARRPREIAVAIAGELIRARALEEGTIRRQTGDSTVDVREGLAAAPNARETAP